MLPPFLAEDWSEGVAKLATREDNRPHFVMSGKLTKANGMQTVIPLMKHMPDADLYICGSGEFATELFEIARKLKNVHFIGDVDEPQRAELIANATAMIVPSLLEEPSGDHVLEAFSLATPAIVRRLFSTSPLLRTRLRLASSPTATTMADSSTTSLDIPPTSLH